MNWVKWNWNINEFDTTIDFKSYRHSILDYSTELAKIKGSEIKNLLQSTMNLENEEKENSNLINNSSTLASLNSPKKENED